MKSDQFASLKREMEVCAWSQNGQLTVPPGWNVVVCTKARYEGSVNLVVRSKALVAGG
jgi:hypothetical protein